MKTEITKSHWPEGTYIEIDRSIFPDNPTITAYEGGQPIGEYKDVESAEYTLDVSPGGVWLDAGYTTPVIHDDLKSCDKDFARGPFRTIKEALEYFAADAVNVAQFHGTEKDVKRAKRSCAEINDLIN